MKEKSKDSEHGIAGLVLGIISIVFFWVPFLGLASGIIGIVCSNSKKPRKVIATGGIVTSIIGTVLSAVYLLIWIFVGAFSGSLF